MMKEVRYKRQSDFLIQFGRRVRTYRLRKGMSMQALADACEVDYSQIARIEHSTITTSLEMLRRVAGALDLHPRDLMDYEWEE